MLVFSTQLCELQYCPSNLLSGSQHFALLSISLIFLRGTDTAERHHIYYTYMTKELGKN
jgi:hypothetical protein